MTGEPLRILIPDTDQTRGADWGDLRVDLVHYAGDSPDLPLDDPAEVLVVGPTSYPGAFALADSLPRLRMVQILWAGVDDWVGRLRPSVLLSNSRGAYGLVTAELATASLLALLRGLPQMLHNARSGRWEKVPAESLWGRRILIVGAGDVGRQFAHQVAPYETDVVMVGRTARETVRGIDEIDALLPWADVVVVATPLTEETRHLVDKSFLAAMRDGAVLVNAGRGPVVVTDDLLAEARTGRLRAVLDVTDPEPLPPEHPLWRLPGVLITPHAGGGIAARAPLAMSIGVEQIRSFARGDLPPNLVERLDGPPTVSR